jgi:hypothetical protein
VSPSGLPARHLTLAPAAARALLEEVLVRAGRPRALVAFDLDSTLLDNRPRQAVILAEYGRQHGLAELAAARPEHVQGWDLQVAMRATGLDGERVAAHYPRLKEFWKHRFFTSQYCRLDGPIDGAAAFVARVVGAGAQVAYVTGRHEAMRTGTVESFVRLGFPAPARAVALVMKPTLEQTDDGWKLVAHGQIAELGEVVAAFDNEPAHANGYRARFPDALVVHLATDHSGRDVALAPGIASVPHFL